MKTSNLQALIFDVDGTLAETERDGHRIAFNTAFADFGLTWHWDVGLYGKLLSITGGKERIRHFVAHDLPPSEHPKSLDSLVVALHAAKTAHYLRLLENGKIALRPGIARLLNEARAAGLRLAIATTTTPENVSALLSLYLGQESLGWFEAIGAGDIVPHKKPAPDIYEWVLKTLNLPAEACLAFEDSANGLRSARAAGIPTWVTTNAYTAHEDFSGALSVTHTLENVRLDDLLKMFSNI